MMEYLNWHNYFIGIIAFIFLFTFLKISKHSVQIPGQYLKTYINFSIFFTIFWPAALPLALFFILITFLAELIGW